MINYEFSDLFNQDSVKKQVKITYDNVTITNEDLFGNEMTFEESLCSESQLKFGCCESSMVSFRVANIFSSMMGKTLDIQVCLEGNAENPFRYGFYKVQSDKPTADRDWREIVAYDALYDIIKSDVSDWYNSVLPNNNTTITMRQFRKRFVEYFGLKEADASLINDDMVVTKTISIQSEKESENAIIEEVGLSGLDVMSAICEINGCFGHIGRDGKFHYIYLPQDIQGLYPSGDIYPSEDLYPADFKGETVSKSYYISCKYEDYKCRKIDKLQIRQEENDIGAIVGEGSNAYVIEGNFLVYGKTSNELNRIAKNIFTKIEKISYRPFEAECVGNPCIEVGDAVRLPTTYEIVESYVLKRTLKGIQALKDSYSSAGNETFEKPVNSVQKSILAIKGKTNKIERTLEETKSTITDVEQGLESQIKQTAGNILTTVAGAEKIWDETGYDIDLYGFGQPEGNYEASQKYAGKYYLDQESGQIYICAAMITPEGQVYYWQFYAVLQPTYIKLTSKIEQNANGITAEVERATSAEGDLSSRIQITESSITSKVSKGDVISEINQSPEAIELSAGRLIITSGNFTLDSSGNVSVTGNVNATSGIIGPFSITGDGLEWKGYGTKIWANSIETSYIRAIDSSSNFFIGVDGKPIFLGPYNFDDSIPRGGIFVGGDIYMEKDRSLKMVNASGSFVDINASTSDEREKNILSRIGQKRAVDFIKNLVPIAYQYKAEDNPVTHWGFGAQTTLSAMKQSGIGESQLVGRNPYIPGTAIDPDDEETFFYTMQMNELAAPYAAALQYLFKEIETIKNQIGGF